MGIISTEYLPPVLYRIIHMIKRGSASLDSTKYHVSNFAVDRLRSTIQLEKWHQSSHSLNPHTSLVYLLHITHPRIFHGRKHVVRSSKRISMNVPWIGSVKGLYLQKSSENSLPQTCSYPVCLPHYQSNG